MLAKPRLALVIGTRPQIIKAAVLSTALKRRELDFLLIHTGQHYSAALSDEFFKELNLQDCEHNLKVGSGTQEHQISTGTQRLIPILKKEKVTHVVVIGDSNPARVGAQASKELGLPLVHCEAGLRSFSSKSTEENNRVFIDQHASLHLCSTKEDAGHIRTEMSQMIPYVTGDLLVDAHHQYGNNVSIPKSLTPQSGNSPLWVLTLHRYENVVDEEKLATFIRMVVTVTDERVFWPVHPRLQDFSEKFFRTLPPPLRLKLIVSKPLTYTELNYIKNRSILVITDSVGLQVESYLSKIPCLVLRDEAEHRQLLSVGASILVPSLTVSESVLLGATKQALDTKWISIPSDLFGKSGVSDRMATVISKMA